MPRQCHQLKPDKASCFGDTLPTANSCLGFIHVNGEGASAGPECLGALVSLSCEKFSLWKASEKVFRMWWHPKQDACFLSQETLYKCDKIPQSFSWCHKLYIEKQTLVVLFSLSFQEERKQRTLEKHS